MHSGGLQERAGELQTAAGGHACISGGQTSRDGGGRGTGRKEDQSNRAGPENGIIVNTHLIISYILLCLLMRM